MNTQDHLKALRQWVRSDDFALLVAAYPEHYKTGTTGTGQDDGRAVLDEAGRLKPERFAEYMAKFQSWLLGNEEINVQTFQLVKATLAQMHDSINFEDGRIGALFAKGKEMSMHMLVVSKDMRFETMPIGGKLGVVR